MTAAVSELTDLCARLVTVRSTSDRPHELDAVLNLALAEVPGFHVERFETPGAPSALISNRPVGWRGTYRVILNAHLDVIDGSPDQFAPRVEGNRLVGRGTFDMKGGAAAELLAFRDTARDLRLPVAMQLVTDEEVRGALGTALQIDQGVRTDIALVGEPTALEIVHATKGVIQFTVVAEGVGAHASLQWQGVNAVRRMVRYLAALDDRHPELREESWTTSLNPSSLSTVNRALNVVPAECRAAAEIRYVPADSADAIVQDLMELAGDGVRIEDVVVQPAQDTAPTDPDVVLLGDCLREVAAVEPVASRAHYATDMRHFTARGMSGVAFGPSGDGAHAVAEWVDIGSVELVYRVLCRFLERVGAGAAGHSEGTTRDDRDGIPAPAAPGPILDTEVPRVGEESHSR